MPTIADVARLAGVSPAVVSRVLSGDESLRVREATRERVIAAVRELGYAPNHAARALRRARAGLLAVGVHEATNPVYRPLIEGAQSAAAEAGYALMLADVDALEHDEAAFRRIVTSGAIDGLLLQRAGAPSDVLIEKIAAGSVPVVLLNEETSGSIGSVAVDDYAASRLATRHLTDLGHRRVAFLQVDGPQSRAGRRRQGWMDALSEAGLDADPGLVVDGGHSPKTGEDGMRQLLARTRDFTGVFVANVLAAVGAVSTAREAGYRVPDDLSVVAMHDFDLAAHLNPALTTVRLPLAEMGARAVQLLLAQRANEPSAHEIVRAPEPQLVVRASTRQFIERKR